MRARKVTWAFAAGVAAVLALGLSVPAASAAPLPLPTCSATDPGVAPNFVPPPSNCWYLPASTTINRDTTPGEAAGYLGADDSHTRYRYVQANFQVTPQFVNLNGTTPPQEGGVGVEECDPNIAYAAQFGVVYVPGTGNVPFYAQGFWNSNTGDPCINHTPLVPNPSILSCPLNSNHLSVLGTSPHTFCGSFAPIATGDKLGAFAIYYTPGGHFRHQVSFGFCDTTASYCRQAYAPEPVNLNFWEIGVGVFSGMQNLGAPASIPITQFTQADMNCYSCVGAPRPISVIQPVNPFGVGGLEQVEDVNTSGQSVLGPANSLDLNGDFTIYNGSTSA